MMKARKARMSTEIVTAEKEKEIKELAKLSKIVKSLDLKEEERTKIKNVS